MAILGFIYWAGNSYGGTWQKTLLLGFLVLSLFFCVLLHEFGHALAARLFGIGTRDIVLLPIGGMARLDYLPEKPWQEFVVAAAGPFVNLMIFVAVSFGVYLAYDFIIGYDEIFSTENETIIIDRKLRFFIFLAKSNLFLMLSNLIPAFPLDGSRILRAGLSKWVGRRTATFVTMRLGQFLAVLFIIYALVPVLKDAYLAWFFDYQYDPNTGLLSQDFTNGNVFTHILDFIDWEFQPTILLLSVFILFASRHEYHNVRIDEVMVRYTVSNVMRAGYTTFHTADPIGKAIVEARRGVETAFLVFDDEKILRGVLDEDDILDASQNNDDYTPIGTYMQPDFKVAKATESVRVVYDMMLRNAQSIMPIVNAEGDLIGVTDMSILKNFLRFHQK